MSRLLMTLVCATLMFDGGFASATDLYVSPTGNDASVGSLSQPLATLEAARDAVRQLRRDGKLAPAQSRSGCAGGTMSAPQRWN